MIKDSLKKTSGIIKKNRKKVLLLLSLQVVFFIMMSIILYNTLNPAMRHARDAIDYYDSINISENPGMFDYMGKDPLKVYNNYKSMVHYLKLMALFSFLAYIIIEGGLWALSDDLIKRKSPKQFLNYFINFAALSLGFVILSYIFVFNALRSIIFGEGYGLIPLILVLFLLIMLAYLLFTGYSLIGRRRLKDILRVCFLKGVLNFHSIIFAFMTGLLIIALSSCLLYLAVEANLFILLIAMLLFVFSLVFTRLFFMVFVNGVVRKRY
ncbi:hypothetical protein KY366_00030 [Candidatus Woesearchaeota archaeon]|nr:hypothetical protein [Candidatus Woesearchaeota archaeon]